jgi:hypothetical protein
MVYFRPTLSLPRFVILSSFYTPNYQPQPRAFTQEELLSLLDEDDDPSVVDDVIARRNYQ